MPELEPASIDKFDSGPLMLEAAAQGLGVALMHASHYHQAKDSRLVRLFDVSVKSPYRYWFVCRPKALQSRAVKIFHARSEERRVGKGCVSPCSSRWAPCH